MRDRPLRLAFVNGSLDTGGAERQMLALAQRLPRERFEVEFVLLTHGGPLAQGASEAGLRVRILDWPRGRDLQSGMRRVAKVPGFVSAIRAGHYDIVDAWLYHGYALTAATRPLTRVGVFVSGRRSLSGYKTGFNPLDRALDAIARRSTDMIVANSPQVRDNVVAREQLSPDRIRVIRNGVDVPPPMPADERTAIRAKWGFRQDHVVAGCVANYKPGKGLETLLRVVDSLRSEVPGLRLVLVGEGKTRPALEQMIADRGLDTTVRLHGHEPDARRLCGAFDLAVLASEAEGLPNGLLEASAASLPIVTTAAGGAAEVVLDGRSGWVVPVGDEHGLAAAIGRLARDADMRLRFGAAGRLRAETTFGMDRFVSETAALYEELARQRGLVRSEPKSGNQVPSE